MASHHILTCLDRSAYARAAQARQASVPATGHRMPIDEPDAVRDAIVDVLDALRVAIASRPLPCRPS
jgi:hypothetical protein